MIKIPDEQIHDLKQQIYDCIISNGYATNKEEAKNVASCLLSKTIYKEVEPNDYTELKTKALKFDKMQDILRKNIDKVDFLTQLLYILYVKTN